MSKKNVLSLAGVLALFLILTSCFYESLSWSPDGRYLAFASGDAGKLWRWDGQTGLMEGISLGLSGQSGPSPAEASVKSCGYLPAGDRIAVLTEVQNNIRNLYLLDPGRSEKNCTPIGEDVSLYFDISRQGKIYYIKADKEKGATVLWEYGMRRSRAAWRSRSDFGFIRVDPEGKRILYVQGRSLNLLNLDSGSTRTLVTSVPKRKGGQIDIRWSLWVNPHTVLYVSDEKDLGGELVSLNLDDLTTRPLMSGVSTLSPPSLSPDAKRVAVTASWRDAKGQIAKEIPSQVAAVELATGKWEWLTNEPFGANTPAFAPNDGRLAYLASVAKVGGGALLKVLNLKTKGETIAWRNDEERLYATAMTLLRAGQTAEAAYLLRDLVDRFPSTPLKTIALFQGIKILLKPPLENVDFAYALMKEISTPGDIISQRLRDDFWRPEDRIATDPAEDWISTYTTDASRKEWGFNTDLPRDLRALWVRAGKGRLYIRVDYGSDKDLSGITLQDTQLLFDYGAPEKGERRISPGAEWDRGAKRQVLVRHWFEAAEKSQYDMEIKDEKGEVISRFLASGFAPPSDPLFDVADLYKDGTGSVVYVIDRKVLGLEKAQKVNIQVCTYKGGIDKLERPRQASGCDVADAFGPENTAGRMKGEAKGSTAGGGQVCRIKGIAGSFTLPAE